VSCFSKSRLIFEKDEGECCMEDDDDDEEDGEEEEEGGDEEEAEDEDDMAVEDLEENEEKTNNKDNDDNNAPDFGASANNPVTNDYRLDWDKLQQMIAGEGEETLFPPLDGTAFFVTTCKINHSCDPNVQVSYHSHPQKGLELQMKAIKEISPNEELVQSYIDQFQSKKERQKALKDYGFVCDCVKCQSE
jgi:hypothetical protein